MDDVFFDKNPSWIIQHTTRHRFAQALVPPIPNQYYLVIANNIFVLFLPAIPSLYTYLPQKKQQRLGPTFSCFPCLSCHKQPLQFIVWCFSSFSTADTHINSPDSTDTASCGLNLCIRIDSEKILLSS